VDSKITKEAGSAGQVEKFIQGPFLLRCRCYCVHLLPQNDKRQKDKVAINKGLGNIFFPIREIYLFLRLNRNRKTLRKNQKLFLI